MDFDAFETARHPTHARVRLSAGGDKDPARCQECNGSFGIDVRNEDGLIVMSDMSTGLWTFRMDGFQGWSGKQWGMPDLSSA